VPLRTFLFPPQGSNRCLDGRSCMPPWASHGPGLCGQTRPGVDCSPPSPSGFCPACSAAFLRMEAPLFGPTGFPHCQFRMTFIRGTVAPPTVVFFICGRVARTANEQSEKALEVPRWLPESYFSLLPVDRRLLARVALHPGSILRERSAPRNDACDRCFTPGDD